MTTPLPANEEQRLAKLLSYDILDTESETAYDDITRLVAQICNVPIAVISLVDRDRQWFKSVQGLDASQTDRDISFCTHTIWQHEPMVIHDATIDPRFANNPLVTGAPYIRFYAGAPLITSDGYAIGSLCAIDTQPRELSDQQLEALVALSRLVINQMELQRSLKQITQETNQRQQAEVALEQQEQKFAQLIGKVPGMLFQFRLTADGQASFPYVSDRSREIYGLTPAEIMADANRILSVVSAGYTEQFKQELRQSAQTLQNFDWIVPITLASGQEKWLQIQSTPELQADQSILWHGILMDVTEQRQLQQEHDRLLAILETTPDIVGMADAKGQSLYLNQAGQDFWGILPEQTQSFNVTEVMPAALAETFMTESMPIAIQNGYWSGEITLVNEQGDHMPASQMVIAHKNEQGDVAYFSTIIRDLTEQKEQAKQLQEALQTLQQTQAHMIQTEKMSSLGQLVAGIAHEINNPIGFIHTNLIHAQGYCNDLLSLIDCYQHYNPTPQPAIADHIEAVDLDFLREDLPLLFGSMRRGTDRVKAIVESLRTFSRLDEAEFKDIDLHASIDSTLMVLAHRLKEQNTHPPISVIKAYGQLPKIQCYAGQLNQVIMNLLNNAIEAFEESRQPQPEIRIQTRLADSKTVEIAIADNGSGIPESLQERIFDPFFTTKPVGKGIGMGLSTSYQIITDTHGGSLTCTSALGQGSTFTIHLPITLPVVTDARSRPREKPRLVISTVNAK